VQDGGDGPVALPLRSRTRKVHKQPVRANSGIDERGRAGGGWKGGLRSSYGVGGGVEEGEAARAAGGAEAGVDGGVAVEVRAAAELLLVHLPCPHGRRRLL
jgi:hypothetical protein